MATHDSHAAAEQAAVPTDHDALEPIREAIRTVAGVLDERHADHCCPTGDWRPGTLSATEKTWQYPHSDAVVRLESPGLTAGWTVSLERGEESVDVCDRPIARATAFQIAKDSMARHAHRHEDV